MSDFLTVEQIEVLSVAESEIVVLEVAEQGPRGIRGPAGPAGGSVTSPVGATALSGHSIVAVSADGKLIAADCTVGAQQGSVYALLADAYAPGADAVVQDSGVLEFSGWAWTPGLPLVVGVNGQPSHTLPVGAKFSQTVATALAATRILIDIQPPISIAT